MQILGQRRIQVSGNVVLWNREAPQNGESKIPEAISQAIADLPVATHKFLTAEEIPTWHLDHEEIANWRAGIPIIKVFVPFAHVDRRSANGSKDTDVEKRVKDVLGFSTYLATEYFYEIYPHLQQMVKSTRESKRHGWMKWFGWVELGSESTKPSLTDQAVVALVETWPDFLRPAGSTEDAAEGDDARRKTAHLRALLSRGRRPAAVTWLLERDLNANSFVRKDIASRLTKAHDQSWPDEWWFWTQCVQSLIICEAMAAKQKQVIAEISDTVERRGTETRLQMAQFVHGLPRRVNIAGVLPAVFAGLSPTDVRSLCPHLQLFHADYAVAEAMGCLHRHGEAQDLSVFGDKLKGWVKRIAGEVSEAGEGRASGDRRRFLQHAIAQYWPRQGPADAADQ